MERSNSLTSGHRACQGCGEALGARYVLDAAMRATDGNMVAVNSTGCLEVFSTPYPESSWQLPWLHSLFGNGPAVASGVAAALRAKGREDIRVVGQAGDGGTVDIGFGCLSGMFERNDDVLFVCYDNEGYMNTGVQRSGATPPAARTANTKAVGPEPGNVFGQGKNVPLIAMAHEIPYVATATVAEPARPRGQGREGDEFRGAALPARLRSLPARLGLGLRTTRSGSPGWPRRAASSPCSRPSTARSPRSRQIRRQVPVEEYLRLQRRYAHLFGDHPVTRTRPQRRALGSGPRVGPRTSPASAARATRDRGRAPLGDRVMDKPFAITLDVGSSRANKTGSWRTERAVYVDRMPPCNHACPAGENIQAWLYEAEEGGDGYERAWRKIMEDNPFPAIMGRVCYHPCETACNRGQLDEAVGINSVERFLGDEAIERGWRVEVTRRAHRQAGAGRRRRPLGPLRGVPPGAARPRGDDPARPGRWPAG